MTEDGGGAQSAGGIGFGYSNATSSFNEFDYSLIGGGAVFDTDGNYLREFRVATPVRPGSKAVNGPTPTELTEISANGAPNSLCIPPGSDVIFVGETTFPGRIIKATLQGEVLGVIGNSGRNLGEFSGAHGLACPSEDVLYVAETSNSRAQKLLVGEQGQIHFPGRERQRFKK
jgi:hypothetical protein